MIKKEKMQKITTARRYKSVFGNSQKCCNARRQDKTMHQHRPERSRRISFLFKNVISPSIANPASSAGQAPQYSFMGVSLKHSGETILEVLIATVILVGVLASCFALLNRGAATNTSLSEKSAAISIAREGIEAVRNIRDTNWLKYSGDKRNKWLCLDSEDVPDKCLTGNPEYIVPGFYQIDFSESAKRFFLTKIDAAAVLDINNNSAEKEQFRLFVDNASGRYTHTSDGGNNTVSSFYRQIELTPVEADVCPNDGCIEKKLKVVSRVQWVGARGTESVILETHLFDFFDRNAY